MQLTRNWLRREILYDFIIEIQLDKNKHVVLKKILIKLTRGINTKMIEL